MTYIALDKREHHVKYFFYFYFSSQKHYVVGTYLKRLAEVY